MDTIACCVDLEREHLLPPVCMEVKALETYRAVETAMIGPTGPYLDHPTETQWPVQQKLSEMVSLIPTVTSALWPSLEACIPHVYDPSMEFTLLHALSEQIVYVAFRPNQCSL